MHPERLGASGEVSVVIAQGGDDVLLLELLARLLQGNPVAHQLTDDLRQLPVQISAHQRSDLVPKGRQDNTIDDPEEGPLGAFFGFFLLSLEIEPIADVDHVPRPENLGHRGLSIGA